MMDSILELGIALILWLQSLGVWLIGPARFFSALGVAEFYLLIAPAVFWCLDPALGTRLGLGLMISGASNGVLKLAFHTPRPYWYDGRIQPLISESTFGTPSGHAQNAVVVWGLVAAWFRRRWVWALAIALMALIGVSRLHLGVHFPHDVLVGWAVGGLLLWALLRFEAPFLGWLRAKSTAVQAGLALAVSLALILAGALARFMLREYSLPPEWIELASRSPGAEPFDPLALAGVISPAAALFGLALGAILLQRQGWFDVRGPVWQRLLRYLVGLAGVILIWAGLDGLFPDGEALIPYFFRYLRYAMIGFWVTFLAPQVFIRLRLARMPK